jgi:hypothetical protein
VQKCLFFQWTLSTMGTLTSPGVRVSRTFHLFCEYTHFGTIKILSFVFIYWFMSLALLPLRFNGGCTVFVLPCFDLTMYYLLRLFKHLFWRRLNDINSFLPFAVRDCLQFFDEKNCVWNNPQELIEKETKENSEIYRCSITFSKWNEWGFFFSVA